jgi:hypothetical protein
LRKEEREGMKKGGKEEGRKEGKKLNSGYVIL